MISIGLLRLHLQLPLCHSLKEKRGLIKPVLARLHREYNLSAAEVDLQDVWQEAIIACVIVSDDPTHNRQVLQKAADYTAEAWPDLPVLQAKIELL